jgi:hypothetical protein
MSVSQNPLHQRREYPPKGPEHRNLREIASALLILDFSTLQTLQKHKESIDYQNTFLDLTADNLASINHNNRFQSTSRAIRRIRHHVRTLSDKNLYKIVSKPSKAKFTAR